MELTVYLWVEDITVFIRELIRFFKTMHLDNKIEYREKYDPLDNVLDRYIHLWDSSKDTGVSIYIVNYHDISYAPEEYGTDVNIYLLFNDAHFGKRYLFIAEIVNWIMRTSYTDLAIESEGDVINFKRVQGKIYYGRESDFLPGDYIPVKDLDFDREEAFEYTKDDEWVYCSEEHIQEIERREKEQEKLKESD